jgi:hypothetical protein
MDIKVVRIHLREAKKNGLSELVSSSVITIREHTDNKALSTVAITKALPREVRGVGIM